MLPRDDGPVGRTLLDVEDKDRLIAVGTVSIAAGTLAIVFSTRGGTVASVLVWIFGAVAVAAFVALPWSWYRRSLSWLRSRVLIRLVPRRLDRPTRSLATASAARRSRKQATSPLGALQARKRRVRAGGAVT